MRYVATNGTAMPVQEERTMSEFDKLKKPLPNTSSFDVQDEWPLELEAYNRGWNDALEAAREYAALKRGDMVLVPRDFMQILAETLIIAKDWNAPDYYDIEVSEKYNHLKDPESHEPDWLCLYEITRELKTIIAAAEEKQ
jgi:hypothetical protein